MASSLYGFGLGIIGAVIGGLVTRTPQGAMWGFSIGMTLGGLGELVFAGSDTTVTKGPRIQDLKIQTSTYGVDIPKVYGAARISGNIFWAAELEEKKKIRHLDGDAEFWEYRYYANFAIGLCEGPIAGVRRIWLDSKLYIDFTNSLLNSAHTYSVQRTKNLTVYKGTESQTADSTISEYLGAANTPGYRGLAYIVFNNLNVRNYGNRIPEVTVEVVADGSAAEDNWEFSFSYNVSGLTLDESFNLITTCRDDGKIRIYSGISDELVAEFYGPNMSYGTGIASGDCYLEDVTTYNGNLYSMWYYLDGSTYKGYLAKHYGISANTEWVAQFPNTGWYSALCTYGVHFIVGNRRHQTGTEGKIYSYAASNLDGTNPQFDQEWIRDTLGTYSAAENVYCLSADADGNLLESHYADELLYKRDTINGSQTDSLSGLGALNGLYYERNNDLMICAVGSIVTVYDGYSTTKLKTNWVNTSEKSLADVVTHICTQESADSQDFTAYTEIDNTGKVEVYSNYIDINSVAPKDGGFRVYQDFGADYFTDFSIDYEWVWQGSGLEGSIWTWLSNSTDFRIFADYDEIQVEYKHWGYSQLTFNLYHNYYNDSQAISLPQPETTFYCTLARSNGTATFDVYSDSNRTNNIVSLSRSGNNVPLRYFHAAGQGSHPYYASTMTCEVRNASIEAEGAYSLGSDLTAFDIDVSDLISDNVLGYVRSSVMSKRRALEPLMATYQFDAAEIDHKIHFVKRGGANQVTITEDELAAHEYGSGEPDKLVYTKSMEQEVPEKFNLTYITNNRDYQEGSVTSKRMSLSNKNISKVEFPVVLTHDQAKQLADIMHSTAITERTRYEFTTTLKYLYLAPTDVITVIGYKMRIDTMAIKNNLLQITGPAELDANYTSYMSTQDPSFTDQTETMGPTGPTTSVFLDIPMLNDLHNEAGFYVAAHGIFTNWPGAQVYNDGPIDYAEAIAIVETTVMGNTTTALATTEDYRIWDRGNTVDIILGATAMSLSNKTASEVLNGQNWAAVGQHGRWEIIGFQTVTDNGDGTFTLSNLLRGLRNTHVNMANHETGDSFVILDTDITQIDTGALGRYKLEAANINVEKYYKVATLHVEPENYGGFVFTNTAQSLKPYPPADVRGSRDGSNNLTVTFKRSGRYQNGLDDFQDVPLGEDSEEYEVDIYDTDDGSFGTIVDTLTGITSETFSYPATTQTNAGITPGDLIDMKIYMISAETEVDRGNPAEATV
jgi:hypothetical protein